MFKPSLLFSALLSFPLVAASAQTPDTATIRGTVADQTHAVVTGAVVKVTNIDNGLDRTAVTNSSGQYSIVGLPIAGEYDVTANKQGFAETRVAHVKLEGGNTAVISLALNVTGGKTEVTVVGAAGELRTDQPQLGIWLSQQQINETPLPNRRITYLPLLSAANRPAINQGDIFMDQNLFTTNGAGRRQSWFEIDGTNGNDSWGRQTIFANLPLTAVQQMTVLTNSFSTEYGASTGSVVNIVTKSGGNGIHGEGAALWRPADLGASLSGFTAANAVNGNDILTDKLWQESGAIGGALSSTTHFFLAGEHSDEDKVSPVNSALAPGNYVGVYHDWLGFLRLDHQFSQKNNAFLRGNLDAYSDTNPNGIVGGSTLPSVARVFHRRTYSLVFGDTAVLSPNLLNNARFQFQLASPITEFDPVVYGTQYVVPITGLATFTSGTSQSALLMNRQYEMSDTVSATKGRHQINFGADALIAHTGGNSKEFGGPIFLGRFMYNTCNGPGGAATPAQIQAYCESPAFLNDITKVANYQQSFGTGSYTVNDALWAVFAQDDYHVSKTLTINAGLRYERQTFTDATLNFAPRAGFVYDVGGMGKTVVRGGFGIYHSQVVDNSQANYVLTGPTGVFTYTATPGQVGFPFDRCFCSASGLSGGRRGSPADALYPARQCKVL